MPCFNDLLFLAKYSSINKLSKSLLSIVKFEFHYHDGLFASQKDMTSPFVSIVIIY